jgi:hypothetical protein
MPSSFLACRECVAYQLIVPELRSWCNQQDSNIHGKSSRNDVDTMSHLPRMEKRSSVLLTSNLIWRREVVGLAAFSTAEARIVRVGQRGQRVCVLPNCEQVYLVM